MLIKFNKTIKIKIINNFKTKFIKIRLYKFNRIKNKKMLLDINLLIDKHNKLYLIHYIIKFKNKLLITKEFQLQIKIKMNKMFYKMNNLFKMNKNLEFNRKIILLIILEIFKI